MSSKNISISTSNTSTTLANVKTPLPASQKSPNNTGATQRPSPRSIFSFLFCCTWGAGAMINDVENVAVPTSNTPSGTVSNKSVTKKQTTTTGEQEKPAEDSPPVVPEPVLEEQTEGEVVIDIYI